MNRKQFIILLVLVAVIGAAGWMVHQRGSQSWQSADRPSAKNCCPIWPSTTSPRSPSSPARTSCTSPGATTSGAWANAAIIRRIFPRSASLLLKLADLKIVQTEEVGPSQLGRFQLLPPGAETNAATLVEFKDSTGKTLTTLLLGKKHLGNRPPIPMSGMATPAGPMAAMSWPAPARKPWT